MSTFERVMRSIEAGRKVRIVQDFYGIGHVEMPTPVIGWPKRRIKLRPEELEAVKAALAERRKRKALN